MTACLVMFDPVTMSVDRYIGGRGERTRKTHEAVAIPDDTIALGDMIRFFRRRPPDEFALNQGPVRRPPQPPAAA